MSLPPNIVEELKPIISHAKQQITKRDADTDETEGTTCFPPTNVNDELYSVYSSCTNSTIDTQNRTIYFCRNTRNSTSTENGKFTWKVRMRLCPWESVVFALNWFWMVHYSITGQCESFCNKTEWRTPTYGNGSKEYISNWTSCPLIPGSEACGDLQSLIEDLVSTSFSCNISQWAVQLHIETTDDLCIKGKPFIVDWQYNGEGLTTISIRRPKGNDDDDDDTPETSSTTEPTASVPSSIAMATSTPDGKPSIFNPVSLYP